MAAGAREGKEGEAHPELPDGLGDSLTKRTVMLPEFGPEQPGEAVGQVAGFPGDSSSENEHK